MGRNPYPMSDQVKILIAASIIAFVCLGVALLVEIYKPPPTAENLQHWNESFLRDAYRRAVVIATCPNGQTIYQDPESKRLIVFTDGQPRLVAPGAQLCR
ncbi:hypothetical protein CPT_Seuss107 [Caulobacter phage Seuss]|uniref:Uncharacterized protein n=1 Tax=Caulobacter phage Seuss TaxID=1675601 RepID=A0A0K1LN40_9CAUD|nr:hypothetical protein HOR08_gp107 [Caulobacter phage Seuss]AKU43633.1 hypothetical protein CPT_Seuss107 [Caulobacter phage Seuss]